MEGNCHTRHLIAFLTSVVFTAVPTVGFSVDLASQKQALDIISGFADQFCKTIPLEGGAKGTTLSAEGKAEVKGLLQKVLDLGVSAAAKYTDEKYAGPLQRDLAKALADNTNCRSQIWKDLKDRLLVQPSGAARAKPPKQATTKPKGTSVTAAKAEPKNACSIAASRWRGAWDGESNTTPSRVIFNAASSHGCLVHMDFYNRENPQSKKATHVGWIEGLVTDRTLEGRWSGRPKAEGHIVLTLVGDDRWEGNYDFSENPGDSKPWFGVRDDKY
jgi:hypothetical protein